MTKKTRKRNGAPKNVLPLMKKKDDTENVEPEEGLDSLELLSIEEIDEVLEAYRALLQDVTDKIEAATKKANAYLNERINRYKDEIGGKVMGKLKVQTTPMFELKKQVAKTVEYLLLRRQAVMFSATLLDLRDISEEDFPDVMPVFPPLPKPPEQPNVIGSVDDLKEADMNFVD